MSSFSFSIPLSPAIPPTTPSSPSSCSSPSHVSACCSLLSSSSPLACSHISPLSPLSSTPSDDESDSVLLSFLHELSQQSSSDNLFCDIFSSDCSLVRSSFVGRLSSLTCSQSAPLCSDLIHRLFDDKINLGIQTNFTFYLNKCSNMRSEGGAKGNKKRKQINRKEKTKKVKREK
jgi:hypothetical protein